MTLKPCTEHGCIFNMSLQGPCATNGSNVRPILRLSTLKIRTIRLMPIHKLHIHMFPDNSAIQHTNLDHCSGSIPSKNQYLIEVQTGLFTRCESRVKLAGPGRRVAPLAAPTRGQGRRVSSTYKPLEIRHKAHAATIPPLFEKPKTPVLEKEYLQRRATAVYHKMRSQKAESEIKFVVCIFFFPNNTHINTNAIIHISKTAKQ